MISIVFVCLGNICRSPMAEAVFRDMIEKEQLTDRIRIDSAATGTWELGNPVHHGTRQRLAQEGISVDGMFSRQLNDNDLHATFLIAMDDKNIADITKFINNRPSGTVQKLLSFSGSTRDIADPWYTGDFNKTYEDVLTGCTALLNHLKEHYL